MGLSSRFKPASLSSWSFFDVAVAGLTFGHLVTALTWFRERAWFYFLEDNFRANCYSFFSSCADFSFRDATAPRFVFALYLVLSFSLYLPLILGRRKWVLGIFTALLAMKTVVFLSRYNLMGNYHTMHLSLALVLLLSRGSFFVYRLALCLQYFWAGTIKLNMEWLSGAALVKDPYFFPEPVHLLSLSYVVVLELVLVWGLLSANSFLRRLTLIQLAVFHVYSYFIVGSFYPLIMLGLLAPLWAAELVSETGEAPGFRWRRQAPAVLFLFAICLLNLSSKFRSLDPAKDGAVRGLSLNMLDAKTFCNTKLYQVFEDGSVRSLEIPFLDESIRVRCDPLFFEGYLRQLCRHMGEDRDRSRLSFHLETRRFTENKFTTVRSFHDVCREI